MVNVGSVFNCIKQTMRSRIQFVLGDKISQADRDWIELLYA